MWSFCLFWILTYRNAKFCLVLIISNRFKISLLRVSLAWLDLVTDVIFLLSEPETQRAEGNYLWAKIVKLWYFLLFRSSFIYRVEFDHWYLLNDPFPTHSLLFQMKMGASRYVCCCVVKGWFFARSSTSHAASRVIFKFSSFSVCSWRKTSGVIYLYSYYSQRNLSCTIRRRCSMSKPKNGGRWAIQSHISNGRPRCWDYGPSFCKWPICWEAQLVADLWYHQDRDMCLVYPSIHSYSG